MKLGKLSVIGATFAAVAGIAIAAGQWPSARAETSRTERLHWLKLRASTKEERSRVAEYGVTLEAFRDGAVFALGNGEQRDRLARDGWLENSFAVDAGTWDFPANDSKFHNYDRMLADLRSLAAANPDIMALDSIGRSVEGRELWRLRVTKDPATGDSKPGAIIMAGHHAREHLSMEMPLLLAQKLAEGYRGGDADIVRLVDSRDIHLIPMVNPDGAEYDIETGRYRMWRKNRSLNAGRYGVDLNRNYGYKWGTGGSSSNPADDTFKGPQPFSEPETQAIKAFVERQSNVTVLLSLHTFSELVLYPWGHTYDSVSTGRDKETFEKMARQMAAWNGYTPQQSSGLYIASGDTTDWAYGEHKIFAFTFELDPASMWSGGFYPGQAVIEPVFRKNLKPFLYLIDLADNPYRATEAPAAAYGVPSLPLR